MVNVTCTKVTANAEEAAIKVDAGVKNTASSPTEPVEDDEPKLPLWKVALKQKKEAEMKKREEEEKKLVSDKFLYSWMWVT